MVSVFNFLAAHYKNITTDDYCAKESLPYARMTVSQSITQFLEWPKLAIVLLGPLWVLQLRKCHMIMSGNDCWNSVCFSCCRKVVIKLADVTLSGSLFQNCAAATGNARPPMVDSLNSGIRKRFDPAERSAGRPDTSAVWTNELR